MKKYSIVISLLVTIFFFAGCEGAYVATEPTYIVPARPQQPSQQHIWIDGDWYGGTWNSNIINNNIINISVNNKSIDNTKSIWYNGRFFKGNWNGGTWENGRMYNGNWNGGIWNNGIWNNGNWNNGQFRGGIWVDGIWNGGIFNCDSKPSYWLRGIWNGGDFENGYWYTGNFNQSKNSISRFGTKSFFTKQSIWMNGQFNNGQFHSYLNLDSIGNPTRSLRYHYSFWKTGNWNGGDFYGGVAHAIDFNNGNWWGGIIREIDVFAISATNSRVELTIQGDYKYNPGDSIYIIDNSVGSTYSSLLNISEDYISYKVLSVTDNVNFTNIELAYNCTMNYYIDNTSTLTPTGLKLTTIFRNSNWMSGVWINGIFESGYFVGGVWYGGVFKSNWGR